MSSSLQSRTLVESSGRRPGEGLDWGQRRDRTGARILYALDWMCLAQLWQFGL